MKLGQLIDTLESLDPDLQIWYFGKNTVGELDSYRGIYSHLALEFDGDRIRTVGDLLQEAKDADGKTFTGYKGGEFVMSRDTPVWASDYGQASGLGIAGIECDATSAVIRTVDVNDYVW